MKTKTFSGRASMDKLAFADALAEREFGMSYGQFCSSTMLDYVCEHRSFPDVSSSEQAAERAGAFTRLREMGKRLEGSSLADLDDAQMKERIAGRYA